VQEPRKIRTNDMIPFNTTAEQNQLQHVNVSKACSGRKSIQLYRQILKL